LTDPYRAPTAELSQRDDAVDAQDTYAPKIFTWNGRIGRVRYVAYSCLMLFALMCVVPLLLLIPKIEPFVFILFNFSGLATLPVGRRRLHDLGHNGWFALVALLPVVNLLGALYLMFAPGAAKRNRFGPRPGPNANWLWFLLAVPVLGFLAVIAFPIYIDYIDKVTRARQEVVRHAS